MSPDHADPFDAALRRMWKDMDDRDRLAPFTDYTPAVPEPQRADLQREYHAIESRSREDYAAESPRVLAGRYEIQSELARGGMGIVHLGRDLRLDRPIVLKTPCADREQKEELRSRFEREAKTLSKLEANGICAIYDLVEDAEALFVVMPFIPGHTLADHVETTRMSTPDGCAHAFVALDASTMAGRSRAPQPQTTSSRPMHAVLDLVGRVARAVHAAHEAGVVHRDLKPANIMVKPDGDAVVLDFGLAFDVRTHGGLSPQRAREGTPVYMAPEQIDGAAERIDRRTDVYALGVILYEVLTLNRPYSSTSLGMLRDLIARGRPKRPRELNPAIPKDLEAVCLRAMAMDPARRYATALELAEDLDRVRKLEPTHARPLSVLGRGIRRTRRNPVAAFGLAAAGVAGVLAFGIWIAKQSAQAPARAFQRVSKAIEELREPDPRDLDVLAALCPDPRDAESLRRNPGDPIFYAQMQKRVIDAAATRGSSDGGAERLLAPRETITDTQPVFRFEVPNAGEEKWSLILSVWPDDAPAVWTQAVEHTGAARTLEVVGLPTSLQSGRTYVWSIRRADEPDPEHPLYAPDPVKFRIEGPGAREAILAQTRSTGAPSFDALLRANALLVRGFAEAARAELDGVDAYASRSEERLALSLRAEIALRLGDMAAFDGLRDEVLRTGASR